MEKKNYTEPKWDEESVYKQMCDLAVYEFELEMGEGELTEERLFELIMKGEK